MVIKPTVGRVVWYYPTKEEPGGVVPGGMFAALIAKVYSDDRVNLCVIDSEGGTFPRTNVPLVQENAEAPAASGYCTWMPYQIGQAKRHAAEATS